jgi:endonuclease/exonuclease/phosphatase family metal-dependent hydrolase
MKLTVSTASHGNMTELPDIIGFHGITAETRADLETRFPDYYFFGFGTSKQRDGLQNPIAFRRSLLALHGFEQFWLSDLPPVPGSRFVTDQTDTPRCCTAAVLMLRDGYRPIRVYNAETDTAALAKVQGVSLILSRVAEDEDKYPGSPVILMGDFHDAPGGKTESAVTKFSYRDLKLSAAAKGIYTNCAAESCADASAEVQL